MQLGNSRQKGKDRGEETGDLEENICLDGTKTLRAGHSACEQGPLSCARRKNDLKMGDVEKDWDFCSEMCPMPYCGKERQAQNWAKLSCPFE